MSDIPYIQKNLPFSKEKTHPTLETCLRSNELLFPYPLKTGNDLEILAVLKPYHDSKASMPPHYSALSYHLDLVPVDRKTYTRQGTLGVIDRIDVHPRDWSGIVHTALSDEHLSSYRTQVKSCSVDGYVFFDDFL